MQGMLQEWRRASMGHCAMKRPLELPKRNGGYDGQQRLLSPGQDPDHH